MDAPRTSAHFRAASDSGVVGPRDRKKGADCRSAHWRNQGTTLPANPVLTYGEYDNQTPHCCCSTCYGSSRSYQLCSATGGLRATAQKRFICFPSRRDFDMIYHGFAELSEPQAALTMFGAPESRGPRPSKDVRARQAHELNTPRGHSKLQFFLPPRA